MGKIILILFILAVLSGFFWSHKMLGKPLSEGGDEIYYSQIAKNILEHSSFSSEKNDPANIAEPVYPLFLSGVYFLFGTENFDAVRIIQIFLFAFTVLLIYFLTREILGKKIAFFAGLLTALFFPLAASASSLCREILFTFFVVFLIFSLYKAQTTLKWRWFVLSGASLGLAVLTNAIVQFLIVLILVYFLLIFKNDFFQKGIWLKSAILLLSFFLVISPWLLRGIVSETKSVSLNLKSGGVLSRKAEMIENIRGGIYLRHLGGQLLGYYFFEKEGFEPAKFLGHPQTTKRAEYMIKAGYDIEEINKILARENFLAILRNIPQYFAISSLDFLQFNGPMLPNPKTLGQAPMQNLFTKDSHPEIPGFLKVVILLVLRILYWFFFGFVIYGLLKAVKDWRRFGCIILVILYFNLTYSALFGIPRYAIPLYPFYIILFVYGVSLVFEKIKFGFSIQ